MRVGGLNNKVRNVAAADRFWAHAAKASAQDAWAAGGAAPRESFEERRHGLLARGHGRGARRPHGGVLQEGQRVLPRLWIKSVARGDDAGRVDGPRPRARRPARPRAARPSRSRARARSPARRARPARLLARARAPWPRRGPRAAVDERVDLRRVLRQREERLRCFRSEGLAVGALHVDVRGYDARGALPWCCTAALQRDAYASPDQLGCEIDVSMTRVACARGVTTAGKQCGELCWPMSPACSRAEGTA